uniref:Syndecan n=2 Tax=Culex tarsalis TaxID=7177 RepID=A0A1Q3FYK6_CULTA
MSLQRINISRVAAVAVLVAVCVLTASVTGQQQDDQKSNNRNSQSLSGSSSSSSFGAAGSSPNNDIYIDDEGLEGSGSRGEIRDDLEKEDDESSGSGYGDDDEDSSSISNSRSNSNVGILGGGQSGGQGINNQLGGGGQGGSGDHADYDDEDDREDDDLYTETKNPNSVDPSTTDDEDMSTGTGKDGKSSSGGGTSIKHSPDGDLEISQTQHITPTNGEGGGGTGSHGSGGTGHDSNNPYGGSGVLIMNAKNEDRTASFFAQPGILAAVIGGAVVGLLCAILVVMFIVYRMRKKDEGSYALDEPKRSPTANTYAKNANNREFYA